MEENLRTVVESNKDNYSKSVYMYVSELSV